jgi:hypothetical protein
MLFKEVKQGMAFLIRDENNQEWTNGDVVEVGLFKGFITLQFNDKHETYTWGLPEAELHDFINPLRR